MKRYEYLYTCPCCAIHTGSCTFGIGALPEITKWPTRQSTPVRIRRGRGREGEKFYTGPREERKSSGMESCRMEEEKGKAKK